MTATGELIDFMLGIDPALLPANVLSHAKRCVLDLLGVALAGSTTPMARAAARFASGQFAPGDATLVGSGARLGEVGAAWVNGICASALDLDDGHRLAIGHPGAAVIPTALAVAETVGASGADLLAAIVAGYELAVRASVARLPDFKTGYYATGHWGAPGSVSAAAKLLGFDERTFQRALGIALAHGPFPPRTKLLLDSMVKEVIGWSGVVGCSAAFLARDGFAGPVDALDRAQRYDSAQLVQDLGRPYQILSVYFKPYASCRWSHPPIDGALQLTAEYGVRPEEIEEIRVESFQQVLRLGHYAPTTTVAAQYSIPFAIALALSYGRIGPEELSEENLARPELLQLAQKVELSVDPDLDRLFPAKTAARVTLRTSRGPFTTTVEYPRGNPENPLSDEELGDKFLWLAGGVLGAARCMELKAMVDRLEALDNVRHLANLLAC